MVKTTFTSNTIENIFNQAYNGSKNFMTPEVIKYTSFKRYFNRNMLCEISEGTGFNHEKIFGLTIVEVDDAGDFVKKHDDISRCFKSIEDCENRIQELKKEDIKK